MALVERHVRQRHRAVADRAQDEAALDRLDLPLDGARPQRAVVAPDDLVAADVDRLDLAVPADRHRGAQEAQLDPALGVRARRPAGELAQQLDVLARGERALLVEPLARHRVELDVLGLDPRVDAVEASELAQLGARERRLRRTAPAEHDDLLDPARAQRLERVVGDVGPLQLGGRSARARA